MCIKSTDMQYGSVSLWFSVLEKRRTNQLVTAVEEGWLYWTLFCSDCNHLILPSEVCPKDLKDLLHFLPEPFNQHYMTSVCFIDDSTKESRQFTSSVFNPTNTESILQSVMSIQSKCVPCYKIKGDMNNMDKEKYLRLMNLLRIDSISTKWDGLFKCQWSEAFFEALNSEKMWNI